MLFLLPFFAHSNAIHKNNICFHIFSLVVSANCYILYLAVKLDAELVILPLTLLHNANDMYGTTGYQMTCAAGFNSNFRIILQQFGFGICNSKKTECMMFTPKDKNKIVADSFSCSA